MISDSTFSSFFSFFSFLAFFSSLSVLPIVHSAMQRGAEAKTGARPHPASKAACASCACACAGRRVRRRALLCGVRVVAGAGVGRPRGTFAHDSLHSSACGYIWTAVVAAADWRAMLNSGLLSDDDNDDDVTAFYAQMPLSAGVPCPVRRLRIRDSALRSRGLKRCCLTRTYPLVCHVSAVEAHNVRRRGCARRGEACGPKGWRPKSCLGTC